MTKFGFKIRTRTGLIVDNLVIHGCDPADAERKLNQMYLHCEILESRIIPGKEEMTLGFEDIVSLIVNPNKKI